MLTLSGPSLPCPVAGKLKINELSPIMTLYYDTQGTESWAQRLYNLVIESWMKTTRIKAAPHPMILQYTYKMTSASLDMHYA